MSGSPKAEIAALREEIRKHDRLYYVASAPVISDLEYDKLLARLAQLEAEHPELVTPDSPTQRVAGEPIGTLRAVEHVVPMLSIDNTYSIEELREFAARVARRLPGEAVDWVVELKIDGVAVSLVYEEGFLVRGVTRGNGRVGDDVTHNIRTIGEVPLRLEGKHIPRRLEVRGEVYMTNADLVRLNQEQAERGEPLYANTRNVTSGSIRLLDPRICATRRLRLFCYGVGLAEGLRSKTHVDFLDEIRSYGLPITPHAAHCATLDDVVSHCEGMMERLHELDFEIDGLVVKVNRFDQRDELGTTSKSPRWAVAYKFEKYEATTRLAAIRVQVGKSGAITPVADLEPVELAGTTVSRASLHNASEIVRKDVRVGDVVVVEKAGKIIPHIVRVEKHLRKGHLPTFHFPTHCPECGTALEQDPGGVYIRCPNRKCQAQWKERLRYFAGRNAMDIEGLGDRLVDQLVDQGLVLGYGDLYRLTVDQLEPLERMGRKSSESLVKAIEASRKLGLARLLNALAIRHVGPRVAQVLASHFDSMENLRAADLAALAEVNEIGPVIAQSVYDYLHSDEGTQAVDELGAAGVRMEAPPAAGVAQHLAGKTLVVTGALARYGRDEIEALIVKHGGRAASSVSKHTDYVVAGEKAGSKLDKARQLGIPIISEAEFEAMIGK